MRLASDRRPAQALADEAVIDLMADDHLDQAVSKLEEARQTTPNDAGIASDLAAAYFERGTRRGQARDLALALDAAERAMALDRALPEVWFNLALARESLFLSRQAAAAWDGYLELDSASGWAEEARWHRLRVRSLNPWDRWQEAQQRLKASASSADRLTMREIVEAFPQPARLYGEVDLLERWAAAQSIGDRATAAAALLAARSVGEICAARGDWMLLDTVAAIDRAEHKPRSLAALARGHRLYSQATRLYADYKNDHAEVGFAAAARDLARGDSPFHNWAVLSLAACDYHASRYSRALARLSSAAGDREVAIRYPNLAGRAEWIRGLIAQIEAQPASALKSEVAALADFQRSSERDSAGVIEGLLAEGYDILGDDGAAWFHLHRALAAAVGLTDRRSREGIWHVAAEAARRAGAIHTALCFEGEALREALATGNPRLIAIGQCDVAALLARLGRWPEATRAIAQARSAARQVNDEAILAEVLIAEAEVIGVTQREAAVADLSAALPVLKKTRYALRLATLYQSRGRLYAAAGRTALAAADFDAGIDRLELSANAVDPLQRAAYLDRSFGLFEEKVRLTARTELAPHAGTFCVVQRAHRHAAAAWQAWPIAPSPVCDFAAMSRSLPHGAVLIEYLVLPERILAWALQGGSLRSAEIQLTARELARLVTSFRREVQLRGEFRGLAEKLYQALVAPLALPAESSSLLIVPDKDLYELPFSALRNPATGRYLVEDYAIELTPSAGAYWRSASPRDELVTPPTLLAVGDPAFDHQLLERLQRLPAAAQEAAVVGSLYRRSGTIEVLTGAAATKKRVLDGLARYSVVHLGVHAETDRRSPLMSRFYFAPAGGDPGVLFAHELYGRRFPHTDLVVLAGCDTAAGALSPSAGVMSLARPFLAGGVRAVLGSLWAVEDKAARAFSVEFHRRFATTRDALGALQAAQRQLLRSPDPALSSPASWAGFVLASEAASSKVLERGKPRRAQARKAPAGPSL
jgi:CHAT domain-containing protein